MRMRTDDKDSVRKSSAVVVLCVVHVLGAPYRAVSMNL